MPRKDRPGQHYAYCKACDSKHRKESPGYQTVLSKNRSRGKVMRASNDKVDQVILMDCRSSDRKAGRENDLTREFIKELIKNGCYFCGETHLRMTIDRIDNNVGHTMANVNAACIRCNMIRRDMPFEAWAVVSNSVKTARENGLFGTWTGSLHARHGHALTSPDSGTIFDNRIM